MRVKRSAWVPVLIVLAATNILSQETAAPSGLLGLQKGQLTRFPIADWIASTEKRKAAGQKAPLVTCKFARIDVTGDAAAVKLELHREGQHIFTDDLSLYKFPDGWKIVGKIYHRHA